MANPTGGLFEMLVAAFAEASAAPKFQNVLVESIYTQYRGITAQFGQTLQVNIPVVFEGDTNNIGAGPIQVTDTGHNTVNITINNNLSTSFLIRDYDQVRSPQDLKELYVDARMESLLRKVNRAVANLFTATNLANYSTITGGTNLFTRPNIASAWANVVGAGCPVRPEDTTFVTSQVPYGTMLGDPAQNFLQQYVVGEKAAEGAQRDAVFMPQFQAAMKYDQMMPLVAGKYTACYFHRYAIAMIPVRIPLGTDSQGAKWVKEGYVMLRPNLPARCQCWYDPVQQGTVCHVHCVFGLATVRPEFASFLVSA